MPKVITRKKTAKGKAVKCNSCGNPIVPGEKYRQWSFRYGGTYFRCMQCPYPRQSDLTQSNMGGVWSALEDLQDSAHEDSYEPADVDSWVADAVNIIEGVRDMYEEAAENFGGEGPNRERADGLENLVSDLEAIDTEDGWPDEDERKDGDKQAISDLEGDWRSRIQEEVDSLEPEIV